MIVVRLPTPRPLLSRELSKHKLQVDFAGTRSVFMWAPHAAFSARGLDADAFGHTTAARLAAFRNDDCGRPAGIEIEPSIRLGTTWLDSPRLSKPPYSALGEHGSRFSDFSEQPTQAESLGGWIFLQPRTVALPGCALRPVMMRLRRLPRSANPWL